ncbi:DUF3035 domain-containing protein [Phenylobacterium aquaticum]|uniref:DUF3035 domain-containing protein n=1 Tax=Phenylobacterium aquaticum TaxID=1763816 RepID=UPI0026F0B46D|nr:DUF3035 domain-containing protein [Phenylobacterium aquaticum]
MRLNRVIVMTALVGAVGLAGCQSTRKALGMTKVTPDEFRVVAKAPLVVPPDYALRPPAPGEPRPQELQPESAARAALLGVREAQDRSDGEKMLVAKAGADKADPLIRFVVDDENGDIAHKDKSWADRVMFWKAGQPKAAGPTMAEGDTPAPVDAVSEEARIKTVLGDKPVIIARTKPTRFKLPGL